MNDASAQGEVRRLRCPRCGYDVSGVADAWHESCPLEGVCSECGLRFEWREVFDPMRGGPEWFFELVTRRRVMAFFSTLARTMAPWRFWREVRLSLPSEPVRLGMFSAGVLLLLWLAGTAIECFYAGWIRRGLFGFNWAPRSFQWQNLWWIFRGSLDWPIRFLEYRVGWTRRGLSVEGVWFFLFFAGAAPLVFGALGETLGRARVERRHIVRAGVYTGTSVLAVYMLLAAGWMVFELAQGWWVWTGRGYRKPNLPLWLDVVTDWLLDNDWMLILALVAWSFLAWRLVCLRYLRIEHPSWVALAVTVISTLVLLFPVLMFTGTFTGLLMRFV